MTLPKDSPDLIPGMDGWKAIALVMFMAEHFFMATGMRDKPVLYRPFSNGLMGVFALFVVAGYLVTRSLIKEERLKGKIRLISFFRRRAVRILPGLYGFLAGMVLLRAYFPLRWESIASAAILTFNYEHGPHHDILRHLWALPVEEHFFIFWGLALVFLRSRRAFWFLPCMIAISTVWRLHSSQNWVRHPFWTSWYPFTQSQFQAQTLAFGAILAVLENRPRFERICWCLMRWKAHWAALIYLFVISPWMIPIRFFSSHFWVYQPLFTPLALTVLLLALLRTQNVLLLKFLEWRPLKAMGTAYFSIYLWQQVVIFSFFKAPFGAIRAVETLGLIGIASSLSWALIERPLRHWLGTRGRTYEETRASNETC